ncbi:MAG: hypothetical protein ACNA70_04915 [Brevefilum sp.]
MNYGEILSKAWKVIWKHKILWLFGVLAGCSATGGGGGGGGGGSAGSGASNFTVQPGSPNFIAPATQQALENVFQFLSSIPWWAWVLLVIGLVALGFFLSVLFLMAGTLGQAGVIKGASMADAADQDAPALSFGAVFTALKPHYWKVLLLNLGIRIAGGILTLILVVPIVILALCTCCLGFLLVIPIGWLIDTLLAFTTIAIVEEGMGVFPAIGRAWRVITRNLVNVLVMFLILGLGGLIVSLLIALPLMTIPLPLVTNLVITGGQSITAGLVLSVLLFLVFIPLVIFLGGVLRAYILASWTLTYRRLILNADLTPTVLTDLPGEA